MIIYQDYPFSQSPEATKNGRNLLGMNKKHWIMHMVSPEARYLWYGLPEMTKAQG